MSNPKGAGRVVRRGGAMALGLALVTMTPAAAQQRGAAPPPQAPPTPQAAAPIDLTGYWVAVVTEDWRWRMVTPPKGDFASVPLNPAGQKVANAWDPATDGSCLAYGAAGLMRIPTRLHITWDGDSALKIDTDAGQQTRRFVFDKSAPVPATKSAQGHSVAEWEIVGGGRGGRGGGAAGAAPAPRFGNLKVATTNLAAGWLRKNGVPYSENATLTEYLRPLCRAERRRVAGGEHDRVRPHVLDARLRHEHALQEGAQRRQVVAGGLQARQIVLARLRLRPASMQTPAGSASLVGSIFLPALRAGEKT